MQPIRPNPDTDAVLAARAALESVTPLAHDCGIHCGGACCQPSGEDEYGMLLFPGERELYADSAWATVTEARAQGFPEPVYALSCPGKCAREERPLACRLFPLAPHWNGRAFVADIDRRAYYVCPLAEYGAGGLARELVNAAETAFARVAETESGRAHLNAWSELMREYGAPL